jgi:hypothetical protein
MCCQCSSGFRAPGIFPFNPSKFTEEAFAPSKDFRELVLDAEPGEGEHSFNLASSQVPSISAAIPKPTFAASLEPTPSTFAVTFEKTPSTAAPIPKKQLRRRAKEKMSAKKQQSEIRGSILDGL